MKYLAVAAVVSLALLGGGCTTKRVAVSKDPEVYLVRSPSFEQCELEGFVAMGIGRQALLYKQSKEKLLEKNGVSQFQVKVIDDLFIGINDKTINHYAPFGATKFYECSDREGMKIKKNIGGAETCFARLDIQFFAYAGMLKGMPQEEVMTNLINLYSDEPSDVYPRDLIEKIVPMAYRATTPELEFESRRMIFETCLFPEDWKSWYTSTQGK